MGRFTQPDTIWPDVYDPQSLNRYSYTRNNPLKYDDPSGHAYRDRDEAAKKIKKQLGLDPDEDIPLWKLILAKRGNGYYQEGGGDPPPGPIDPPDFENLDDEGRIRPPNVPDGRDPDLWEWVRKGTWKHPVDQGKQWRADTGGVAPSGKEGEDRHWDFGWDGKDKGRIKYPKNSE